METKTVIITNLRNRFFYIDPEKSKTILTNVKKYTRQHRDQLYPKKITANKKSKGKIFYQSRFLQMKT